MMWYFVETFLVCGQGAIDLGGQDCQRGNPRLSVNQFKGLCGMRILRLVDTDDRAQKIAGFVLKNVVKQLLPLLLCPFVRPLIAWNLVEEFRIVVKALRPALVNHGLYHTVHLSPFVSAACLTSHSGAVQQPSCTSRCGIP